MFWAILKVDHSEIIPVEFGRFLISSLGEKVVQSFSYIIQNKILTPAQGIVWTI